VRIYREARALRTRRLSRRALHAAAVEYRRLVDACATFDKKDCSTTDECPNSRQFGFALEKPDHTGDRRPLQM